MKKIYNFSAGPAVIPKVALENSKKAVQNYKNQNISILEMSHRSDPIVDLFSQTSIGLKSLLAIPDNYKIIWLQGGASLQFTMAPMNLLGRNDSADYIDTGSWSAKAINECNKVATANIIASSKEKTYSYIPKKFVKNAEAKYVHITSNNTIFGTQYKNFKHLASHYDTIIADMSSDILSKPIDFNNFGLIYAGAQKNMGPAGVTLVIIREDLISLKKRRIPSMLDYGVHVSKESMFNTPPVFPVFVVNETIKWLKTIGGLEEMNKINEAKAKKIYQYIDNSSMFTGPIDINDRSDMNISFTFNDKSCDDKSFLSFCRERGLMNLKGHRSVGGFRASIYNAMPEEGIDCLLESMSDFERL